jgi:hypothetical protein
MATQHKTKIVDVFEYQREDNIHAVQTWFGDANGTALKYNPDDNEYYVGKTMLRRGDLIAKDDAGNFRVCPKA